MNEGERRGGRGASDLEILSSTRLHQTPSASSDRQQEDQQQQQPAHSKADSTLQSPTGPGQLTSARDPARLRTTASWEDTDRREHEWTDCLKRRQLSCSSLLPVRSFWRAEVSPE